MELLDEEVTAGWRAEEEAATRFVCRGLTQSEESAAGSSIRADGKVEGVWIRE